MGDVSKSSSVTLVPVLSAVIALSHPSATVLFQGVLDGWDMQEGKLSLSVGNIFSQWAQHTLSKHSASCRWKIFKGVECAYAGTEAHCDRSYARCIELSNSINFGGFRWLPSIVDKEVWWGKVPD
jgi:hypothetical protein